MNAARIWLAIALLSLSACASTGDVVPATRIFNEDLRHAFDTLNWTMSEPRSPLALPSGATISTCREYLQHTDQLDRDHPDQMRALQDYVICDSLALLQQARPASAMPIDVGQALATRLDFRTFPSSRGPRTSDQAFLFETLVDDALIIEPNAAMLDSEEWYLRLERVATADFDGDGSEDWLIWIADDSHVGTYQTFHALLIYDVTGTGTMAAASIP